MAAILKTNLKCEFEPLQSIATRGHHAAVTAIGDFLCVVSVSVEMATKTKTRKFLSLGEKAKIIAEAEGGRKKTNIAHDFGISPSSLSTVLKNRLHPQGSCFWYVFTTQESDAAQT